MRCRSSKNDYCGGAAIEECRNRKRLLRRRNRGAAIEKMLFSVAALFYCGTAAVAVRGAAIRALLYGLDLRTGRNRTVRVFAKIVVAVFRMFV